MKLCGLYGTTFQYKADFTGIPTLLRNLGVFQAGGGGIASGNSGITIFLHVPQQFIPEKDA